MSLDELDSILVPSKRLACLGAIAAARKVEFSALRQLLGLSDSDLSKHLKVLIGQHALSSHVEGLQKLVDPVEINYQLDA